MARKVWHVHHSNGNLGVTQLHSSRPVGVSGMERHQRIEPSLALIERLLYSVDVKMTPEIDVRLKHY